MQTAVKLSPDIDPAGLMVSGVTILESGAPGIDPGAIAPDFNTIRLMDPALLEAITADPHEASTALIETFQSPYDLLQAAQEHSKRPSEQALGQLAAVGAVYGAEYILERRSPAEKLLATVRPDNGQSPGMHVDNRDKLPPAIRIEQCRRRLGLNAGPGHRWLLACLPDIVTIVDELGGDRTATPVPDELNHRFQEYIVQRPNQIQCVWIPLPPGWVYIMPSDCMGHDGSTYDAGLGSHMYYFLGRWKHASEFVAAGKQPFIVDVLR